jgi:hypothetical protein
MLALGPHMTDSVEPATVTAKLRESSRSAASVLLQDAGNTLREAADGSRATATVRGE